MKNKPNLLMAALGVLGLLSLLIENLFYQRVDAQGYLQESLFLPLGAFCLLSSGVILVVRLLLHSIKVTTQQTQG